MFTYTYVQEIPRQIHIHTHKHTNTHTHTHTHTQSHIYTHTYTQRSTMAKMPRALQKIINTFFLNLYNDLDVILAIEISHLKKNYFAFDFYLFIFIK